MANPSVLSVGQCGFDRTKIARHLEQAFGARVVGVENFDEALEALRRERFDLVLVNRVNDSDEAPGVDLIRSVKAEAGLAGVPMMLVSNFPEAQQEAEALGALPGFGKSDLASATTRTRLEAILSPSARPKLGKSGKGPAMRAVSWILGAWLLAALARAASLDPTNLPRPARQSPRPGAVPATGRADAPGEVPRLSRRRRGTRCRARPPHP